MANFNDYFANMGTNALQGQLAVRDALNERRINQNRMTLQGQLPALIEQYGTQQNSLMGQNPQQQEANKKYLSLLASTDPEGALKYIMDMQRGGANNSVEMFKLKGNQEGEPIANEIDVLATRNLELNKTDLTGKNQKVQDEITKNNEKIAQLGNRYRAVTNKDYTSTALSYAQKLNEIRKARFNETKDVGDIENKIAKDALAQSGKSIDSANQIINAWNYMTSGTLDFTNPADVRKVIVGFNKLLEPMSAVMADDFYTTVGVDGQSKIQAISNGFQRAEAGIRGIFGGESKNVDENSNVQYLVKAEDAKKVYQSVLAMKNIVQEFSNVAKGSLKGSVDAYLNDNYELLGAKAPNEDVILKASGLRTMNGSVPSAKFPSGANPKANAPKAQGGGAQPQTNTTLKGSAKGR